MAAADATTGYDASPTGAGRRAVTAFFDDRAAAQTAVDDVVEAGVDRSRVTLVEGGPEPVAHEAVPTQHKGFWQNLKDLFMADEDRHAYGEGLRRGGFLVSVETGDADHDRIVDLLDRDGAIDIDARAKDWTLEGWDPVRAAGDLRSAADAAPVSSPTPDAERMAAARVEPGLDDTAPVGGPPDPRAGVTGPTAIRDPGAGSSRLRTYVANHVRPDPQDAGG